MCFSTVLLGLVPCLLADGYGHGHSSHGIGTACIVKGSYCQCHYCKCEKGHIHCKGHGHGGGYGKFNIYFFLKLSTFKIQFQARNIVMVAWKGSIVTATIANVSMVTDKMAMEKDAKDTSISKKIFCPSTISVRINVI